MTALRGLPVTTSLASCPRCLAWVRADDTWCADCGRRSNHPRAAWLRRLRRGCTGVAVPTGIVLGSAAAGLLGAVVGLLAGWLVGRRVFAALRARRAAQHDATGDSLVDVANALARQRDEVEDCLARLVSARASIVDVVSDADRPLALEVTDRRAAVRFDEYDALVVRSWQIAFARWVNALAPILEGFDAIDFAEADRRLALTGAARTVGHELVTTWRRHRAAASPPGQRFLASFADALAGVDTLRSELALRKAVLADPRATALLPAPRRETNLDRELERFSRLADEIATGRYASAAAALGDEQYRLAGETEIEAEFAA